MKTIDKRKKAIVTDIIRQLHDGLPVERARERIAREVGTLTSAEITTIEQSLMDEGVSPDEIKRFCNVHALLFASALEETAAVPDSPAHPLNVLRKENRAIEGILASLKTAAAGLGGPEAAKSAGAVRAQLARLAGVDRHYALKENALFPYLETHGFTGPSKVMWAKHNEVRELLKKASTSSAGGAPDAGDISALAAEVEGMIFKEENILFPAALEKITPREWVEILRACEEIGYPYAPSGALHETIVESEKLETHAFSVGSGDITLPSGRLGIGELSAILDALPVDITFVDSEDRVKFFTQSKDRVFIRAKSVLGRNLQNCHPPKSVEKVVEIVKAFRSGARDSAEFWIQRNGRFVSIRYFAVRDPNGKYLGTLEVTQDLTDLRALTGERRLLDEGGVR